MPPKLEHKTLKHTDMKKKYLQPETDVFRLTTESMILAASNGEDLNVRTYGSYVDEDEDDFWN